MPSNTSKQKKKRREPTYVTCLLVHGPKPENWRKAVYYKTAIIQWWMDSITGRSRDRRPRAARAPPARFEHEGAPVAHPKQSLPDPCDRPRSSLHMRSGPMPKRPQRPQQPHWSGRARASWRRSRSFRESGSSIFLRTGAESTSEKFLILLDETARKRLVEIEADLLTQDRQHLERKCGQSHQCNCHHAGIEIRPQNPLYCSSSSHRIVNMRGPRPTLAAIIGAWRGSLRERAARCTQRPERRPDFFPPAARFGFPAELDRKDRIARLSRRIGELATQRRSEAPVSPSPPATRTRLS